MNEPVLPTNADSAEARKRLNITKLWPALIVLPVILLGAWALIQKKPGKPTAVSVYNLGGVLSDKDRHLSESAKKIYNDRIKKGESDLSQINQTDRDFEIKFINDHIYLAEQYFGLGQMEKSKQEYLKALDANPKHEAALVGLAFVYSDAGAGESAKKVLDAAIQNNKGNYNLWLQYIGVKKILGESTEEISQTYKSALDATNSYPDILTSYAQFETGRGNYANAISLWQQAAVKSPENSAVYNQEITRLKNLQK